MLSDALEFFGGIILAVILLLIVVITIVTTVNYTIERPACTVDGEMMHISTAWSYLGGCYYQQPDGSFLDKKTSLELLTRKNQVTVKQE